MKTAELTGAALDWAVAKCEGYQAVYTDGSLRPVFRKCEAVEATWPSYSTNWAQGGPIIEREGMDLNPHGIDSTDGRTHWRAAIQWLDESDFEGIGQTPLIAAMRCYVASKLGDVVEVPEELQ